MNAMTEFIVRGITGDDANGTHVIGRCGDVSLRVGDVFETVDVEGGAIESVQIEIVSIQAYGHSLHELGFGMTAALVLRGAGIERLTPRCVLVGNSARASENPATGEATRAAH